jgi:hypothetical protein
MAFLAGLVLGAVVVAVVRKIRVVNDFINRSGHPLLIGILGNLIVAGVLGLMTLVAGEIASSAGSTTAGSSSSTIRASATNPPTAIASAPPTSGGTPASGLELPPGYVGEWLGTITQAQSGANPASFKVMFTGGKLGDRIGTVTMGASAGCTGPSGADITLQAVSRDSLGVTFANPTTNCLASVGGPTTVRIVDNQLDWDLFLTYGEYRGRLSKTG